MRLAAVLLPWLLAAPTAGPSGDLPKPPAGYKWQEVATIKAAVLVPTAWHFRSAPDKGKFTVFVTEDEFTPAKGFKIGVSINAYVGNPNAPAQLEKYLKSQADPRHVELKPGMSGPFQTLQCQYDVPASAGHAPRRIVNLGIVNAKTGTAYLVSFESPASDWDRTWPKGKTILTTLALSTKL